MAKNPIFHITNRAEYDAATSAGEYVPLEYERDGFIHCSYANQLVLVADALFRGQSELVLLEIDRDSVQSAVVDENLSGGPELFPHIYGKLPLAAVVQVHDFPTNEDGSFELPAGVAHN